MATRYFCDGCDTQFPEIDNPNPVFVTMGQASRIPNIPLTIYESETQARVSLCSWACLAAYAARKATAGMDIGSWQFPDSTAETPDVQE